jgi:peptidase M48-like protein
LSTNSLTSLLSLDQLRWRRVLFVNPGSSSGNTVSKRMGNLKLWGGLIVGGAAMMSCSLSPKIPVVADETLDQMVRNEAVQILAAADPGAEFSNYQFQLSAFPRQDVLGLSIGQGRVFISYKLAQLALKNSDYRWLLRQTLAHEIGHELAGHANQLAAVANSPVALAGITARQLGITGLVQFQNYSVEKELQADFYGMSYWAKLGWDCNIWVNILREFQRQNYVGGSLHPTDRRLAQATANCAAIRQSPAAPISSTASSPPLD